MGEARVRAQRRQETQLRGHSGAASGHGRHEQRGRCPRTPGRPPRARSSSGRHRGGREPPVPVDAGRRGPRGDGAEPAGGDGQRGRALRYQDEAHTPGVR